MVILHCLALLYGMDSLLSLHWVLLSHDIRGYHFSLAKLTKSALMLHHKLASARRLVSSLDILEIVFDLKVTSKIAPVSSKVSAYRHLDSPGLRYAQSISFEYLRRAFAPISCCMISAQTFQSCTRSDGFTAFGDCGTMVLQKKRSSCLDHVLPPIVYT
jgi:hypothetical protein